MYLLFNNKSGSYAVAILKYKRVYIVLLRVVVFLINLVHCS